MESMLQPISFSIFQKDAKPTFHGFFSSLEQHRRQKLKTYVLASELLPFDER